MTATATPQLAVAGGDSNVVEVTMSEVTNMAATMSPDEATVVIDAYSMLWTLPAGGGEATQITEPSLEATRPSYSPNGDLIAFQSYRGGQYHIWVVRPDGTGLRQLTTGPYDHREPSWSPDGSSITFASDRGGDGSFDIWSVDVMSEELTRWTDSPKEEYEPSWSPNGDEIAFVESKDRRDTGIVAVDADGTRRAVADQGSAPSWAPDGDSVLYWHEGNYVLDGSSVTSKEDVFAFAATWTGTDEILYTADGGLRTRNLETGEKRAIPFEANVPLTRPTWEPKERDWSSSKTKPVRGFVNPRLSPDGKSIVFGALNNVWLLKNGSPRQLTNDPYWEYDFEWSRDGRSITYTSDKAGSPDVYRRTIATGEERRLTDAAGAEYGASLSPNGKRLAFLDEDNMLSALDLDTGKVRELHKGPGGELWEGTSWSPDGRYIAMGDGAFAPNERFREDFNSIWIVNSTTGEATPHEPGDLKSIADLGDSGPTWSPDGKWLAFIMESSLWIIPVQPNGTPTGPARQVTEETADSPSWSGDSQRLLYLHHGKLKSVAIDGSNVRSHRVNLRWQNDVSRGRTIIHAGRLWDGTGTSVREDVDIILRGDRVVRVQPHTSNAGHRGARFIDASDKTVMPGMFEMHSHPQDMRYYGTKWSTFYLSMGFTSAVSMGGFLNEAISTREAAASGELLSPRVFAAGELFDGARVSHPETRAISSDEQLEKEIARHQALEPDLYKTYVRTAPDHMARVAEAAHADGVPAFSHILTTTATLGLDGTSHLGATQRAGYNNVTSPAGVSYQDVIDVYSKGKVNLVATPFGASQLLGLQPELADDPRVQRLLPSSDVERVERGASRTPSPETVEEIGASTDIYVDILRAGGNVSAGTDAPLAIPGIQNHMVLRAFVEGGMTEAEALQTATSNAAKQMGVAQHLGTIERGKFADLVFVDGHPLENIEDLANVDAVMKGGHYTTQEELLALFPHESGS